MVCDSGGNAKEAFAPGETVYIKGIGMTESTNFNLWIQEHDVIDNSKGDTVPGAKCRDR